MLTISFDGLKKIPIMPSTAPEVETGEFPWPLDFSEFKSNPKSHVLVVATCVGCFLIRAHGFLGEA